MTLRELIAQAGGDLDRSIYFLADPEYKEYDEVATAQLVSADDQCRTEASDDPPLIDRNDDSLLPVGAIVLFPH